MQNAKEQVFQQDIIDHLLSNGWKIWESAGYDRKHAPYTEDLVGYLSETPPEQAKRQMKERRTVLLSAAVTGKIDVRSEA